MAKDMIEVENVNHPGHVTRVDAAKYASAKAAMLAVLPAAAPGLTQSETREAMVPHLDPALFPEGKTSGWWAKTVQLDLEAKGVVVRENSKPLRWHRA